MYVEVVVAVPVFTTFYYNSSSLVQVGDYVSAPFGSRSIIGLVINILSTCNIKSTKDIDKVISIPRASARFINFIQWVAQYNIIPSGMLLKLSLSGMKEGENYYKILQQLNTKGSCNISDLHSIFTGTELCKLPFYQNQ